MTPAQDITAHPLMQTTPLVTEINTRNWREAKLIFCSLRLLPNRTECPPLREHQLVEFTKKVIFGLHMAQCIKNKGGSLVAQSTLIRRLIHRQEETIKSIGIVTQIRKRTRVVMRREMLNLKISSL